MESNACAYNAVCLRNCSITSGGGKSFCFKISFYFIFMNYFPYTCVCAQCAQCSQNPEEVTDFPTSGIIGSLSHIIER